MKVNDPIQQLMDGLGAQWQVERSNSQMTLGELLSCMKIHEKEIVVHGMSAEPCSYRGYYCDISFEPGTSTVEEVQAAAEDSIGSTFCGYKGGDYVMGKSTPVWVSYYGSTGKRLMGFDVKDDELHAITSEEDDEF